MATSTFPPDPITCAHCGTASTGNRQDRPWCAPCGIWLTLDELTAEWVSHAEKLARDNDRLGAAFSAQAQQAIAQAASAIHQVVPADWSIELDDSSIMLHPPAGTADLITYVSPCAPEFHYWGVLIHDRGNGVDAPLFAAGGAHAARYDDAAEALIAAVRAAGGTPNTST
ncbi:hypothetical protein [Nocardia carnea]|uniref:hypothetical protein n=1 Tax=Nocardia carnea TaxID=37328 RepID=UPI002453CDD7|nr:hypothetical protein [Nocardia carnea]